MSDGPAAAGIIRRGILVVVSAPSGGGKTTLVKAALAADAALSLSVVHHASGAQG